MSERMARPGPRYLPGDPAPEREVERMIRVDLAGEYGATRIYAGQLSVLGRHPEAGPAIREMAQQEERHLKHFEMVLPERRVRPTALAPLWHAAGWALGAATAALGPKGAMACTVAVEEEIDRHYAQQYERLGSEEQTLKDAIEEFRQEELEHRDTGLDHGAEDAPAYPLLYRVIRRASRAAIWLSERI